MPTPKFPDTVVLDKDTLEEALKTPETCQGPATVDDAPEINPLFKLASPATDRVEEADKGAAT